MRIAVALLTFCSILLSASGAATYHAHPSAQRQLDATTEAAASPAGTLLHSLDTLVQESVGTRQGRLHTGLEELRSELTALTKQSEQLQAALIENTAHERLLTTLTEREKKKGDSFVLPLHEAAQIVLDETDGGRRASSAPIHNGQGASPGAADPPFFVPHRRGRDDVLAMKLISLLEAGACALDDSRHVLDVAAALQTLSQNKSQLPTEGANPDALAAALDADEEGEGRREMGAYATEFVRNMSDRGTNVEANLLSSLRGGCGGDRDSAWGGTSGLGAGAQRGRMVLRGGALEVDLNLNELASRTKQQVFPFLPDLKIDRRRMVKEMTGIDPATFEAEESEEEDEGWYDRKDPLDTDESELYRDEDGEWRLRDDLAPADPEYLEELKEDDEVERKAALYRARKLPPLQSVPEFSDDPRVRLAAQRNFTKHLDDTFTGKIKFKEVDKREEQRARQARLLQRDLFSLAYGARNGTDDYISKEEARRILDDRDRNELYRFYCDEFLPRCLQHPDGPDVTLQSLPLLKEVYTDERRFGGIDPELLYPDDPYAVVRVENDERATGEADHPDYPRNFEYKHGDWSTRIIGIDPLMPCINSKFMMKALKAANVTARRLRRQQAEDQEEFRQLVVALGMDQEKSPDAMEDADVARQRRLLERWGSIKTEKLNDKLMELTSRASEPNKTEVCEVVCDKAGPMHLERRSDRLALGNLSLIIADGADVNYHDPLSCGFTPLHVAAAKGSAEVVAALAALGADVAARSDNGGTPLHYAAFNDQNETVQALIGLGAEVDARNDFQQTPLHLAASLNLQTAAAELLAAGADPALRDAEGLTPADLVADLDFSGAKLPALMDGFEEDRSWEELLRMLREESKGDEMEQ